MTTPRLIPFPATTPGAGVFSPFVIISDSNDEITTLPVRPAPQSPDCTLALYGYPLDSGDDSSDENMSETAKSLHTQTASTSVRTASPSTCHPLLSSEIPSLSSPPSLLPSSSLPSPLLLPSSSRKKSRSPLPSPPPTAVSPLEHIESVGNDIETLRTSLAFAMHETMTPRARVGSLEQNNVVTRESLRITKGRLTRSQLQAEYVEQEVRELWEFWMTDRLKITELRSRARDIEASFWDLERHLGT
ncbi:hypothetical protein Tco_0431913 [Tanacetum coccineum]